MRYFKRRLAQVGVDFHVGATLAAKLWQTVAGGVMLLFIPHWLTDIEQGYYYTFASILAVQMFFELGLNLVVVQMVGHEYAHLNVDNGSISGPRKNIERLASLFKLLRKWYAIISILFLFSLMISGSYFFIRNQGGLSTIEWLPAWVALVISTSVILFISPFLAVMEGCGYVGNVAKVRFLQSLIGNITLWILLSLGFGLSCIPVVSLVTAVISTVWFLRNGFIVRELIHEKTTSDTISWKRDIFPFQWKIALSWISGYFSYQLFTPLFFSLRSAEEAGKMGLSLTITSTIIAITMSWVNAKIPVFTRYISLNDRAALDAVFWDTYKKSAIFNLFCNASLVVMYLIMSHYQLMLISRLVDPLSLLFLCAVSVTNHFVFSISTYMRAHKQEPIVWSSVFAALLTIIGLSIFVRYGMQAATAVYFAINAFVTLPWVWLVFVRFCKEHQKNNKEI